MDMTVVLNEIGTWPADDRVQLVHRIWDQLEESGWRPTLTDEQAVELDRRLDALDADPGDVVSWDAIIEHLRRPR
ncbi:MAG TPA: addiction module protein [Pirellulales bacterium]|nr:addiction module protein [Pirellulales bacterium]